MKDLVHIDRTRTLKISNSSSHFDNNYFSEKNLSVNKDSEEAKIWSRIFWNLQGTQTSCMLACVVDIPYASSTN